MIIPPFLFKQGVATLLVFLYGWLLLYTSYLQEEGMYRNTLRLHDVRVGMDVYKFLQGAAMVNQGVQRPPGGARELHLLSLAKGSDVSSDLVANRPVALSPHIAQHNMGGVLSDIGSNQQLLERGRLEARALRSSSENEMIKEDITTEVSDPDFFYLPPPFPNPPLGPVGPVFIEGGLVHLHCMYSFDTVQCTVSGHVVGQKAYLSTTYFVNPLYEIIAVEFDFEFMRLFFGGHTHQVDSRDPDSAILFLLQQNTAAINLLSNYILLYGSNGTALGLFCGNPPDDAELRFPLLDNTLQLYSVVQNNVGALFVIANLKLLNYLLLLFNFIFTYLMHLPVYFLASHTKHEKQATTSRTSESDTALLPCMNSSPISITNLTPSTLVSSTSLSTARKRLSHLKPSLTPNPSPPVLTGTPFFAKHQLLLAIAITNLLLHVVLYHLVNMLLHVTVNSLLVTLLQASPDNIRPRRQTILSSLFSEIGPATLTISNGSALFANVMNLAKCITTLLLSLAFHGLYGAVLYAQTVRNPL